MVEPIFDYQFRLILIGDSTVGKSSLLKYFTDGKFAEVRSVRQISDPKCIFSPAIICVCVCWSVDACVFAVLLMVWWATAVTAAAATAAAVCLCVFANWLSAMNLEWTKGQIPSIRLQTHTIHTHTFTLE